LSWFCVILSAQLKLFFSLLSGLVFLLTGWLHPFSPGWSFSLVFAPALFVRHTRSSLLCALFAPFASLAKLVLGRTLTSADESASHLLVPVRLRGWCVFHGVPCRFIASTIPMHDDCLLFALLQKPVNFPGCLLGVWSPDFSSVLPTERDVAFSCVHTHKVV